MLNKIIVVLIFLFSIYTCTHLSYWEKEVLKITPPERHYLYYEDSLLQKALITPDSADKSIDEFFTIWEKESQNSPIYNKFVSEDSLRFILNDLLQIFYDSVLTYINKDYFVKSVFKKKYFVIDSELEIDIAELLWFEDRRLKPRFLKINKTCIFHDFYPNIHLDSLKILYLNKYFQNILSYFFYSKKENEANEKLKLFLDYISIDDGGYIFPNQWKFTSSPRIAKITILNSYKYARIEYEFNIHDKGGIDFIYKNKNWIIGNYHWLYHTDYVRPIIH